MLTILYNRLGFEVVYPTYDSWPDDIDNICQWPTSLMWNASTGKRVIEDLPSRGTFGEDRFLDFLTADDIARTGHPDARIKIEDIRDTGGSIDIFHTTRENIGNLKAVIKRAKALMPNARWISSTVSDYDHNPQGCSPINVCRILPASYERTDFSNSFDLLGMRALGEFLGATSNSSRAGFASFNHNYSARQPLEYRMFENVNLMRRDLSLPEIQNFGGNTRGQGADVTHSGDGTPGKFKTLSPLGAAQLTSSIKAAVHLKSNDWGGGVPLLCMSLGTPIIVTKNYAERTNISRIFRHKYNSLWVSSDAEYFDSLLTDDDSWKEMSRNVIVERDAYDELSFDSWRSFVEKSLS